MGVDDLNNKKRFKTMLNGKTYTLIGSSSDEHMESVSKLLNDELTKLKKQVNNISTEDAAILLAFNAISDQLDKELELEKLKNKVETDN